MGTNESTYINSNVATFQHTLNNPKFTANDCSNINSNGSTNVHTEFYPFGGSFDESNQCTYINTIIGAQLCSHQSTLECSIHITNFSSNSYA